VCRECWERAFYAYGTAAIFQARSLRYRSLIRALTFMGIVVPLLIGGVVLGFGLHASYLPSLLVIASAVGVFQLVFSAWAIVYAWADNLEYSLESAAENFELSSLFKQLGTLAPEPPADLQIRYAAAQAKDDARRAADDKKGLTKKELRYGHRAGLRQFQRKCEGCQNVPASMDSTDCPVCGRF